MVTENEWKSLLLMYNFSLILMLRRKLYSHYSDKFMIALSIDVIRTYNIKKIVRYFVIT